MSTIRFLWQQADWLAEARAWIRSTLDRNNLQLIGEIEQTYVRQWSTVMTVPTRQGILYFKASDSLYAAEPALTDYLARFRPEIFPELLAMDLKRHWMLMRDAGTPLRKFIREERSIARWKDVLPLYVDLQKDVADRTAHLLALGAMDRRLAKLPEEFDRLVADESAMLLDHEDGLTSDEYSRLKDARADFARMCEALTASGIPETIHHDDFHDGNIFIDGDRIIFTDWGESAITHPFFTLVVMMRGVDNSIGMDFSPEAEQVREMYLEQWTSHASMQELRSIARLAQRVGHVNRALTWKMGIEGMPAEFRGEYAAAVPSYLKDFLNADD